MDNAVLGIGPGGIKGTPPKVSEKGRVCIFPDCSTKLSIYNKSAECNLHMGQTKKVILNTLDRLYFEIEILKSSEYIPNSEEYVRALVRKQMEIAELEKQIGVKPRKSGAKKA